MHATSVILQQPRFWKHDEAGLVRIRFYFCRYVVAINAKVVYRFAVKLHIWLHSLHSVCLAWFVIKDFVYLEGKKYPEKVISLTFQRNTNLHMFRDEFVVKKGFLTSVGFLFFPWENSWDQWVNDHCFWRSKHDLIREIKHRVFFSRERQRVTWHDISRVCRLPVSTWGGHFSRL